MLLTGLAQKAISQVSNASLDGHARRLNRATEIVTAAALRRGGFDIDATLADLQGLRMSPADLLEHVIPTSARVLGLGWVDNRLSFVSVSTATARLYGLCKALAANWSDKGADGRVAEDMQRTLIVATIGREDHILGPAVLTERLRRAGHSVQCMLSTDADAIASRTRTGLFDAVLISVACLDALDLAVEATKTLKRCDIVPPVILGGAVLDLVSDINKKTGADLVTNDLDEALAAIGAIRARSSVVG
jgi:methylmalonyl-CoA mutase cobalamin-binding subunit